ncbi:component of the polarisome [Madurella fahalii]|uniref:Component of the polarisome n=1 Tax=Madurella fahalii TaxID=1157608 RepID=A0ABQ0GTJ0_9PEZI
MTALFKPTPIPTAIAHLLAAAEPISATAHAAFPHDEVSGGGQAARVRYELNNACGCLQQLLRVLGRLDSIPRHRKELVEIRQLATVLGAGSLVFSHLQSALLDLIALSDSSSGDPGALRNARHLAQGDVWEMLRGLQDFGRSMCTSETHVAESHKTLHTAVSAILRKDKRLLMEMKALYPDPEAGLSCIGQADTMRDGSGLMGPFVDTSATLVTLDDIDDSDDESSGPPTPTSSEFPSTPEARSANLANILSLDAIIVLVADLERPNRSVDQDSSAQPPFDSNSLEVITVSRAGVAFSPLQDHNSIDAPSTLQRPSSEIAVSAETVFQLPEVTEAVVLDFFRRAVLVSPFALRFANKEVTASVRNRDKMTQLTQHQFREFYTDVYDELVRRNVNHRNKTRGSAPRISLVEPQGLHPNRVEARARLAALGDKQIQSIIVALLEELAARSQRQRDEESRRARTAAASTTRRWAVQVDG